MVVRRDAPCRKTGGWEAGQRQWDQIRDHCSATAVTYRMAFRV